MPPTIRCVIIVSVLLTMIRILVVNFYPITRDLHFKILFGIEERRDQNQAIDPLNGKFIPPQIQSVPWRIKQIFDQFTLVCTIFSY